MGNSNTTITMLQGQTGLDQTASSTIHYLENDELVTLTPVVLRFLPVQWGMTVAAMQISCKH